jgi:hypothetical protein
MTDRIKVTLELRRDEAQALLKLARAFARATPATPPVGVSDLVPERDGPTALRAAAQSIILAVAPDLGESDRW